jgi:Zn-dependent peptidase ImmA (M78 family)
MNTEQDKIIKAHQKNAPVRVVALAKDLGLSVFELTTFPDDLSGMIKKTDVDKYAIYVNGLHHVNRKRFTVAHEIAHFLLHKDYIGDGILDDALYRSGLGSDIETEANALAAKILLPDSLLAKEPLRKMSIRDLAEKFEVSEASMGIRLGEPAYSIGAVA